MNDVVAKIGQSTISSQIALGLDRDLIGISDEYFEEAKALIVSGLRAADRVFAKPVPASDRTLSLGHNSPEQQHVLAKLDELVAAVEATNDFPGEPEFKEQLIAELSAGRRLLEAAKVRVRAAREALAPPLKWILEKAGGAIIGKIAGEVWQYLTHLQIF